MQAASKGVKNNNKWGMFCIPGIAKLDHLRLAADNGISFVRVGTDIDKVETSAPFINLANILNLEVFSNFMKSYVLTPVEFARLASKSRDFGAKIIYLVDSAGCMMPNEVRTYFKAAREEAPNVPLGFHGHNNLGMAVANSLVALEEGAVIIDSSLQGLGRSSGNTSSEILLCALSRSGYKVDIDLLKTMDLGERYIRPRIKCRGYSSLDITAGFAQFHSSYMPKILDIAKKFRIDPRMLIIELCRYDKINAPKDLINQIAINLKSRNILFNAFEYSDYYGEEQNF